jgi:CBS-domain-containing membrane protein
MKQLVFPVIAGFGAAVAIAILGVAPLINQSWIWLMAPFGATTVLVFGVPSSPLAQPKNVIFGHLLTAVIGLIMLKYVGVNPMTMAVATGIAVTAMLLTKTTHPPAGANPLLVMLTGQDWQFLITPVLIGACMIVGVGFLVNRMRERFLYC